MYYKIHLYFQKYTDTRDTDSILTPRLLSKKKKGRKEIVSETSEKSHPEDEEQLVEQPHEIPNKKIKLKPMKLERKTLVMSKPQYAENVEGPQFTAIKLKKTVIKAKQDSALVKLPKVQLKSRIRYVTDWPPDIITPVINVLSSIRQNGILSRNIKEATKIKRKTYIEPKLPDVKKTDLEKPLFGYEDIVDAKKQSDVKDEIEDDKKDFTEEVPEEFTIRPKRPSIQKTDDIIDEIVIKKKLKPVRKSSVTLPEITEPETVTFRPRTTKTKEDVEQEFNIQLDSYAEEEISLTSKVKLKPQRHPTFNEEADETSIRFYEDKDDETPQIVEIIDSDNEAEDNGANVIMQLKKPQQPELNATEDVITRVTISKPKEKLSDSEMTQDVNIKLQNKPKYVTDDEQEVVYKVKPQIEEDVSLSSKVKIKSKKKYTVSEATEESSIQLIHEVEDDRQEKEIILDEDNVEENVEMIIKRLPKKPTYEISEVEELSVEFKPKKSVDETYEEEQLTVSTKRKPRKSAQIQGRLFPY